jgi:hypothetical protein
MYRARRCRGESGMVHETPLAVCFLLIPVVVLVLMLPGWPERKSIATAAAKEAASLATGANDFESGAAAAEAAIAEIAANTGYPMTLALEGEWCRGCEITARVTIEIPAINIPFGPTAVPMPYTFSSTARIDDFRSLDIEGGP